MPPLLAVAVHVSNLWPEQSVGLFANLVDVVSVHQTWGEYRVFYADDDGALAAMPITWTDIAEPIRSSRSRAGEPTVGCLISREALQLMESANRVPLDLRSSGFADKNLAGEVGITQEQLARAKVFAGDLDGAASAFQDLLPNTEPCE